MALTKKVMGSVAAIALLIMVTVVTFAFKADFGKIDRSNKKFANQWYTLTLTSGNPNLPANQQISGTTGSQPSSEECNIDNEGNPCAVELSFSGTPPTFPSGTTVQAAISAGGTVVAYTRQPE